MTPPAPSPCIPRKMMSCIIVCEKDARSDPLQKRMIAASSTRLRPIASDSLPYSGIVTVHASR